MAPECGYGRKEESSRAERARTLGRGLSLMTGMCNFREHTFRYFAPPFVPAGMRTARVPFGEEVRHHFVDGLKRLSFFLPGALLAGSLVYRHGRLLPFTSL